MVLTLITLLAQIGSASSPPPVPEPPAGETLTLSRALSLARARSPLTGAARARAESAARAAAAAGRLSDPSLALTVENWRPGASGFVASTDLDVFAVATLPLDPFTRPGRKAEARGESDEARANRLAAEQDLVLETVRRYLELLRGRELVEALEAQAENLGAIVDAMRLRVEEGYSAEADLLRFRAEAARAENHLAMARIERDRAEADLGFLVGQPVPETGLVEPDVPPPPEDSEALLETALEQRPDVLAARARAARARGTLSLEQGRRYPDIALVGGYKRTAGYDTAVAGVTTTLPFFERNGRARARAEGEARAAELELDATLTRARAETVILVRAARALQGRLLRLDEDLVRPAEEARRSAVAAFGEGAVDVLRVVDAERTHAEARREALDLTVATFLTTCRARLAAGLEALP